MFIGRNPYKCVKKNNCFLEGYLLPHFFSGNAPILSVNLLQTTNLAVFKVILDPQLTVPSTTKSVFDELLPVRYCDLD